MTIPILFDKIAPLYLEIFTNCVVFRTLKVISETAANRLQHRKLKCSDFSCFAFAAVALLLIGIVQRANSIAQRSSRLTLSQACGYTGTGTGFTWEMTEESGVTLTITGSGSDGGGNSPWY